MKHKNTRKVGYGPVMPVIQAISAVTSVASFFQQKSATKKAEAATKEQASLQSRLNDINARRQQIAQLREARIRRAQITTETAGAGLGLGGTSSSVGAIGAVTTQEASNISNIQQQSDFGRAIGAAGTEAYTAMGEAKGWQQMGEVSGSIFKLSGGFDTLGKMFKTS